MAGLEKRDARLVLPHEDIALPFEEYRVDADGNVTVEMVFGERYTEGHFPGEPLVPGHWSAETMAMVAGLAVGEDALKAGKAPVLTAFSARFRERIRPGQEVIVSGHLTRNSRIVEGVGSISIAETGKVAAELESFKALLVDKS
jgi:3-hydroxymyristoyl/3-hydroxydecanoyl-(acyl carrier protein) dehydratase